MNPNTPRSDETLGDEFPKLFFELSHSWRLEILFAIRERPRRHSELSRDLKMSPQETTRHLLRLVEMNLIQKDLEGIYYLTHVGELILTFIPALNVISKYSDFFLSHDFSGIPYEYVLRMGELNNSVLRRADTLSTLNQATQVIGKAKGEILLMNVGRLELLDAAMKERAEDTEIRCILPAGLASGRVDDVNCRYLDEIRLVILQTEELSVLCLPTLEGKMDYSVYLAGRDELSKKWCGALFEYYWERATSHP